MICLIDGLRGIYAPRMFAERYGHQLSTDVREALMAGPDHEAYWDAWNEVVADFRFPDGEGLLVTESEDVMKASRAEIETYSFVRALRMALTTMRKRT